MKTKLKSITAIIFATSVCFTACNSPEKKVENAEENVMDANEDLDNANRAYIAEIEDFKLQSIQKTEENDKAMMEFKERIKNEKQDAKNEYNQKINELEKKNTDLKKRIADYQENGKDNWETFKKEFNHDMDELGNAFGNLIKKNTK